MALVLLTGSAFATTITTPINNDTVSGGMGGGGGKPIWIDPEYPNGGNITYNTEALDLTSYFKNKKSKITKVKCDGKVILNSLGITNSKVVSVGVQEGDFTFNYDFNNCSFWAGRTVYAQATDVVTDTQAITMAKELLTKSEALSYFRDMVGEPMVTYRNNYDAQWIAREGKAYSMSVVFPIKISGKVVYQTYGDPVGLTMDVTNKGVNSVNASVLPFTLLRADSYKLGFDDLIAFIKKGGNNPYYPPYVQDADQSQVKVDVKALSYENVWVISYKYPMYGGQPSIYLTSGIRVKTDKQLDNGPGTEKRDYYMVISDYKVANNIY